MYDFEFVIYDTPEIIINDTRWYLAPYYDYEIKMLSEWFKEGTDYVCYSAWNDEPYEEVSKTIKGYDVLINSKVFTWLSLKYGQASIDIFTDLEIYDPTHYKFNIEQIKHAIQSKR